MTMVSEFLRVTLVPSFIRLLRNRRGATATFLAAAIVPLVAFDGLAIDTGRG